MRSRKRFWTLGILLSLEVIGPPVSLVWARESQGSLVLPEAGPSAARDHLALGFNYTGAQVRWELSRHWALEGRYQRGTARSQYGDVTAQVFGVRAYRFLRTSSRLPLYLGSEIASATGKPETSNQSCPVKIQKSSTKIRMKVQPKHSVRGRILYMHSNTVLSQLLTLLPRHHFDSAVSQYAGDRYVKKFSSWNQLSVLLYAQSSGQQSLRDIQTALGVQAPKLYHLGLPAVKRSTLADANAQRDWRIMEHLFYRLLERSQLIAPKRRFRFKNPLQGIDATTFEVCLSLFPWAKFRQTKGAIKMHCQFDLRTQIPTFAVLTDGKAMERTVALAHFDPIPDSISVFDRGYKAFHWYRRMTEAHAFFVTRAMDNMAYRITGQHAMPTKGVISDDLIVFTGQRAKIKYPEPLRLITHEKDGVVYRFLTNIFHLAASTIIHIYSARWDIELFFKWIKQNLKLKTFLGTSQNAVLTQIWVAMCYYLLLAYIRFQSRFQQSLFVLHRLIQNTLLDRLSIIDLLRLTENKLPKVRDLEPQLALRF